MAQQHILQVSELTKKVRFILESELNTVWLTGEISNFVSASSGHWYLSLKDSRSQVRCAMFRGNNHRVRIKPANGQQVLVRAKVSLYEPRGDFQLIIEQMEDAGDGLLRQKFEQLKTQLAQEGLFSQAFKQALPDHIRRVGIVTSPTGAAVKDILTILKRRNPSIEVFIYPTLVQGESASANIVQAISIANYRQECDVLIVGRGGGSLEDLWCFNEENVVRAIYQSNIPTISAVGHEIDVTLSDHVADLRAATPSAAAEIVSKDSDELANKISIYKQRLFNAIIQINKQQLQRSNNLKHRLALVHPSQQLQIKQQRVDELDSRLRRLMSKELTRLSLPQQQLAERLMRSNPTLKIEEKMRLQAQLKDRLIHSASILLRNKQTSFAHLVEQLHIVSPLATIARGYGVVRDNKHKVITSINAIKPDEKISVQLADGKLSANVIDISENDSL